MGGRFRRIINYFTPEGWFVIGLAFAAAVGFMLGLGVYAYMMMLCGVIIR